MGLLTKLWDAARVGASCHDPSNDPELSHSSDRSISMVEVGIGARRGK